MSLDGAGGVSSLPSAAASWPRRAPNMGESDRLRAGTDLQRYRINDWWTPTGGACVGQGTTMSKPMLPNHPQWGTAVPGMGRTVYAGVNLKF